MSAVARLQDNKPADPVTDREAAEAFTKRYVFRANSNLMERVSPVQTWDGKNKGKPLCRASVHSGGRSIGFHQCPNPGKTQTADGVWWCRVHEPAAVKKRADKQAAKDAEHRAKREDALAIDRKLKREREAFPRFLEALRKIEAGDNEPRATAREALGDYYEDYLRQYAGKVE